MSWGQLVVGFCAALLIATVTTPVGVSGAVFLLPVQLNVLHVPNPAVTPTNLLYNIVAGPGALLRYRRAGQLAGPLTRSLLAGTLPGSLWARSSGSTCSRAPRPSGWSWPPCCCRSASG